MIKSIVICMLVVLISAFAGHLEDERITIGIEEMKYISGPSQYKDVGKIIVRMLVTGCASRVTKFYFLDKEDINKIVQIQYTTVQLGGNGPRPGRIRNPYYLIIGDYSVIGGKIHISLRFLDCEIGFIDGSKSVMVDGLCEPPEELEQTIVETFLKMLKKFDVELFPDEIRTIKERMKIGKASVNHLLKANDYYESGKYNEAIDEINLSIKSNPEYIDAYILQGLIYYDQQIYDKSLYSFNEALKIDNQDACALYNRGRYFYKMKRFEDARTDLEAAVETKPSADAFYALGVIYWQGFEDASDLAEDSFTKALEFSNYTHRDTLLIYSKFLIEKGRKKEARELLERYKQLWKDTAVYNYLADDLLKQCP